MTSKTFKSAGNPEATISVVPSADGVRTVHVHGIEASGVTVPREDAPALALAILEAAGVEPDREPLECQVSLGTIVADLQDTIRHGEALAAAAKERAELEAEALELLNAFSSEHSKCNAFSSEYSECESFDEIPNPEDWLAVARRAREMRAEK